MNIQPLDGKVIAKPLKDVERKTSAGIIIAGNTAEQGRFVLGRVLAAAKEKWIGEKKVPMQVKVGDVIYFDEYTTKEFAHRGIRYYSLDEDKAYGIVDPSELEGVTDEL